MSQPSTPSDSPSEPSHTPPAVSGGVSTTSGLVTGICMALVIFISFCAYALRKRMLPWLGRGAQPGLTTRPHQRNDTLSPEALALIPTRAHQPVSDGKTCWSANVDDDAHQKLCSICTGPFMDGVELRVLPCGHQFDRRCVDPWLLKRSATCPLCRQKVVTKPLTLFERLPKSPRPAFFPATRWKQDRNSHTQSGPLLCSVPSVHSGGPGSGWAGKTTIVLSSPTTTLAPIPEKNK